MYYIFKWSVCQILALNFLFLSAGYCEKTVSVYTSINRKIAKKYTVNISSPEIKSSLNETFADSGLDTQRNLIHPNISIKGATFQQGAVFIDGIEITDPQTAHHILNIPLTVNDIEKIEFLPGQGYAGGINIITRQPENNICADISAGDFSTGNGRVTVSRLWNKCSDTISFENKFSDGYAYDTDYNVTTFFNKYELYRPSFESGFLFGYLKKNFGAKGFYADFPSYERTETYIAKINMDYDYAGFSLRPEFQFKRNIDDFELDIRRPGWSANSHRTDIYTGKFSVSKNNFSSDIAVSEEKITSSNLGFHERTTSRLAGNYIFGALNSLNIDPGITFTIFPDNSVFSPSLNLDYNISTELKIKSMIRHSSRLPSFTELYYTDAANSGNPNLGSEEAILCETGVTYSGCGLNLFTRNERGIIDWIKLNANDPKWQATNIGEAQFYGYEIKIEKNTAGIKTKLAYSYVNSAKKADYVSKYALRYARYLASGEISYPLFYGIEQSINGIYKKRISGEEYFVVDTVITKHFSKGKYYLKVANLLDRNYTEIPFVPMPPRIFNFGITINY